MDVELPKNVLGVDGRRVWDYFLDDLLQSHGFLGFFCLLLTAFLFLLVALLVLFASLFRVVLFELIFGDISWGLLGIFALELVVDDLLDLIRVCNDVILSKVCGRREGVLLFNSAPGWTLAVLILDRSVVKSV